MSKMMDFSAHKVTNPLWPGQTGQDFADNILNAFSRFKNP